MKNKNIFRMTSVLLISILCVCGLSLNAYASDGGEYADTAQTEETTTPPVIVIPGESEDGEREKAKKRALHKRRTPTQSPSATQGA